MVVSGAICGLVGMMEAYGVRGNYQDGISNEYYFDGLLVAMIMGYRPVGTHRREFLLCILKVGAAGMELERRSAGRIVPHHPVGGHFSWPAEGGVKALKVRRAGKEGQSMGNIFTTGLFRQMPAWLRRWLWRPWAVC